MFRYNYVVFGNDGSLMRAAYNDCKKNNQTRYIETLDINSAFAKILFKYHTSPRINKLFRMPFRGMWNKFSFRNSFKNDLPICFIFFGNDTRRIDNGLIEYLRNHYKGCKIVSFCQDLIRTYGDEFEKNKAKFDYVFSFDHGDVQKYALRYQPLVYSKIALEMPDETYKSDVYFLGKAKDRLEQIIGIYEYLSNLGLNCKFFVTGVKKEDQKYADKIQYCDGMTYLENIKYVMATKCMVEIMQGGGLGYTIRYAEALTYGKKIITDNAKVVEAPFYNDSFICAFSSLEDIRLDFFNRPLNIDSNEIRTISPLVFFERIDSIILQE